MQDPAETERALREELAALKGRLRALEAERGGDEAEARYRELFDHSPTGLYQIDFRTGRFLKANRSVCDFFGTTPEEITRLSPYDFMTPASRQLLAERLQKMAAGEPVPENPEYEIVDRQGGHRWLQLYSRNLYDDQGRLLGADVVAHEITARKRAEEALRESEQTYRLITERMADIVWMTDMALRTRYVTPSIEPVLGFTQEERLDQPITDQLTPDSLALAAETLAREMALEREGPGDGRRKVTLTLEYYHKDGSTRWMETVINGIRDAGGTLTGLHGVSRDITARRRAEEERDRLQAQLNRAQRLESIGTLAGGIAHDFNNLLMGIQGYASLMMLDLDPSHPHHEGLKRIEEQVQSGAQLTRQLLGFARGGQYEIQPSDLNEILRKTADLFGRTGREITLRETLAPDLWTVEVDRGQIEQVLLNLFVNARDAMPGGGDLLLATRNVTLEAAMAAPLGIAAGRYVQLTVRDRGVGMDAQTRERIFDPFFTTKAMGRGTGLGLATVYGILKNHRGTIQVESEPGRGTTFTIHLPATERPAAPGPRPAGAVAAGAGTILVVDDEPTIREVARKLLEYLGYRVLTAASGREAIDLVGGQDGAIDLVILDLVMPELSGGEVFDRLRALRPDLRVLLASGYSIDGEARQILARGCNGFLQKPFRLDQLSQKIREIRG